MGYPALGSGLRLPHYSSQSCCCPAELWMSVGQSGVAVEFGSESTERGPAFGIDVMLSVDLSFIYTVADRSGKVTDLSIQLVTPTVGQWHDEVITGATLSQVVIVTVAIQHL